MAILSPLYLLPLLIYALLDKEPLKANDNIAKEITYQPFDDKDNDNLNSPTQAKYMNSEKASIGQQLKTSFSVFLLIYYIGMQTFLFDMTFTAILSTVTFQSSPFPPRDHYQYYQFVTDGGRMLGGMELSVVSLCCPGFLDIVKIRRVWILVLLSFGHVLVFLSISWFHYIDNVYIMFILCLTFGVTKGCLSVHCFSLASDLITDSRKLGRVLGYMEVSISVCRLSAGLLGLFVEKYLREHCEHRLLLGRFCIARLSSPGMWITSNCHRTFN
ncbi:battenin-like [Exaiptasia diaphana]|uniref:Uncharacterized protein n=1 Tax=Exaiptasia diaphana TaxID=2652724 RepID=A0A913Y4S1_EXADI|nr:battenin-like [Exaiptasia diaphana]